MENSFDVLVLTLGGILSLLFVAIFVIWFYLGIYLPFKEERDFIKMEIMRSDGNEAVRWKRALKILYLSSIPFIGRFLADKYCKRKKKK